MFVILSLNSKAVSSLVIGCYCLCLCLCMVSYVTRNTSALCRRSLLPPKHPPKHPYPPLLVRPLVVHQEFFPPAPRLLSQCSVLAGLWFYFLCHRVRLFPRLLSRVVKRGRRIPRLLPPRPKRVRRRVVLIHTFFFFSFFINSPSSVYFATALWYILAAFILSLEDSAVLS